MKKLGNYKKKNIILKEAKDCFDNWLEGDKNKFMDEKNKGYYKQASFNFSYKH
ncbi:MAG: hypothetical protein GWP10_13510 [Nitrospiraceae bacterium]|nr:hypothetical protein [Nitrospiraceae bacterium]